VTGSRRIIDFRNRLTHEYPTVDDELVWALAKVDMVVLRRESLDLIAGLDQGTTTE
ncbi:MAG: DUF86 domain-containing protein, partial [Coriobacteriia bacterium]|nr:DUF86 domain-containing protein [Coriobacteriia bacterium]